MLTLLKDKVYIRYWLAVVVSFLGDAMTLTAVLFLIGTTTASPFLISLVFVAQLLPGVILGPFVGPIIDKFSRGSVMVYADIFRCFIVFCMMGFIESPTLLIILVFLQGVGTAIFEPARMASIPTIVGFHRIPEGIALFQTTLAVIKLAGPIIAGVLLAFQSITIVLFLDAISYIVSATLILSLTVIRKKEVSTHKHSYGKQLLIGVSEMFRVPILLFLMILLLPVLISVGMFLTNYKAVLLQVFQLTNIEFGLMEGVYAFGTVVGAIVSSVLIKKYTHYKFLYASIGALGLCNMFVFVVEKVFFLDLQIYFGILIVWCLFLGLTNALLIIPTSTIFLQNIPEMIRGRGTAIFYSFFNLYLLTGTLIGGLVGTKLNIILTMEASGAILLLTAITYPLFTRSTFMKKIQAKPAYNR
ncbi:MFS family permease [Metabacillus crassostreae]|uniref:MFS transporter n=1 Tax=Metabacillus crassostreae TaxID=929098 RepID=UPI00195B3FF8|nr:MFS transporter [Metabacillus crassostreae]MBM7603195.1 MFS family permease [Metabacillus crassostreae]